MSNVIAPKGWNFKTVEPVVPAEPFAVDDPGCSTSTAQRAAAKLAESGLTLDDVRALGMFPVDDASTVHPDFADFPALVMPYLDAAGAYTAYPRDGVRVPFCRVRYLPPAGRPLPRERRYDQAGASGTRPYFPRSEFWAQAERGELDGVVITEGELKAGALCNAEIPAVAIGGVDCFGDGGAALHPALAAVARQVPDIYILFDSDAAEKPRVRDAEWRLAGQLALAGGRPHIVRLPPRDDGEKMGADDFLVAYGAPALVDLINAAPVVGEASPTPPETVSLGELLARDVPPVPELIPGWLEKGIPTFLCGPGGVHKSRLALQVGLGLNAGVSVLGQGINSLIDANRPPAASLVYVSAEDGADELARRTQAITKALKLKRPKIDQAVFLPRKGKDSALVVMRDNGEPELRPFYHEVMHILRSIPGHKLLVLDSAYDFARWQGHTKVNEDSVNWFIKVFLQGICDQTDCTLLIPWHPSQAGSERGDMSGWSVAWHNAPRARWSLAASKDQPDAFELGVAKRNHGARPEPITLRFHEGALLHVEDVPDDGKQELMRRAVVAAAVRAAEIGTPLTQQRNPPAWVVEEVRKASGKPVTSRDVKELLAAAVPAGALVYRQGHGKVRAGYFPPGPDDVAGPPRQAES